MVVEMVVVARRQTLAIAVAILEGGKKKKRPARKKERTYTAGFEPLVSKAKRTYLSSEHKGDHVIHLGNNYTF